MFILTTKETFQEQKAWILKHTRLSYMVDDPDWTSLEYAIYGFSVREEGALWFFWSALSSYSIANPVCFNEAKPRLLKAYGRCETCPHNKGSEL